MIFYDIKQNKEYKIFSNFMVDFFKDNKQYEDLLLYYEKHPYKKSIFINELFFYWKKNKYLWYLNNKLIDYESCKK